MWNPQKAVARSLQVVLATVSVLLLVFYFFAVIPFCYLPSTKIQILFLYPFLYWVFCVISSFTFFRGRALIISGIIAHVGLIPLIVWSLINDAGLLGVFFTGFALFWGLMCVARLAEDEDRARRQRRAEQIVAPERGRLLL